MKKFALRLNVYRHDWGDGACSDTTNGGISSMYDSILVPCPYGPVEYDTDNPPENLFLVNDSWVDGLYLFLAPCRKVGGMVGPMMGGNYATTSDSRWRRMLVKLYGQVPSTCLPIHDRYETQEMYDFLSR